MLQLPLKDFGVLKVRAGLKLSDKLTISAVPSNLIDLVWDQVEPLIDKVVEKAPGEIVTSLVKERLLANDELLMLVSEGDKVIAANVVTVRTLDSGVRALYIPIVGGSRMNEWMSDFLSQVELLAKDYNCTELRGLAARKGWLSKLKPYGWEEVYTTVRYKIGE